VLGFGFVAGFKWGFPSCLRGPPRAVPDKNLHNSSSISVSIRSPLQSFPRLTEAASEPKPKARPDVIKASEGHFPNSSPSSVRAVPSLRWAELTTNSSQGEKRASELPQTAYADADLSKRCVLPLGNFTVVRGGRRGKKVNLPITGAIIGR
jgi:hypothetical protein